MSLSIKRDRRPTIDAEADSHGTWAVSYGDMITLLLTFFILFMNLTNKDVETLEIQSSLLTQLKKPAEQTEPGKDEQLRLGNTKTPGLDENILKDWGGEVSRFTNRVVVDFPGISFFDLGQTQLTPAGRKALEEFARRYLPFAGRNRLVISAYTDTTRVKKTQGRLFTDNLELSSLRSVRAMRVLQAAGLPLSVMRVGGMGELRGAQIQAPAAPRSGDRGTPLARRVILMIEPIRKEGGV
jgi:flagellar motor protein MotB